MRFSRSWINWWAEGIITVYWEMLHMRAPILLLLAISLANAACEGSISQPVPAVVGNGGGIVNVTMSLADGPGRIFISAYPRSGVSTQESAELAIAYASSLSRPGGPCDVLVDFSSNPSTSYIDGPSAGAALTVMGYALLENRTLRNDTVITGTIEADGTVGAVGGLYEKAKGAAGMGASYFVTPVENIYEMMILREVEGRYGIEILQAQSVEEIIGFMTENRSISQEGLVVRARVVPDVPLYNSSGMERFASVAGKMVAYGEALVQNISSNDNESAAVKEFYGAEIKRQRGIMEKGYHFTAANEAFLNFIDLSTILAISSSDPDLPRKKGEAGICLSGIRKPEMTELNFEWLAGADQRQGWAYDKLENTDIDDLAIVDEKYVAYNELMYAQAWCLVAKELIENAPQGGRKINESAWKGIAKKRIDEARARGPADSDGINRLNIAQDAYERGRYAEAIFDAAYVISAMDAAALSPDEGNISLLVNESRKSLWGRVYQSHAAFLLAQNQSAIAYRTALFAEGLDSATGEMQAAMEYMDGQDKPAPAEEGTPDEPDYSMVLLIAAAISIFLFLVLLFILTRGRHGAESARPGKAHRAEQKKGRARVPIKGSRPEA